MNMPHIQKIDIPRLFSITAVLLQGMAFYHRPTQHAYDFCI